MNTRVRRARPSIQEQTHEEVLHVRSSAFGVDEEERKVLAVRRFVTEPAYVRVNAGVTKSPAPYESIRIDVSISVPCYVEEIDEVLPRVADEVADYLDEEIAKY